MFVLFSLVLALSSQCVLSEDYVIGGIFYKGDDDLKYAFEVSGTRTVDIRPNQSVNITTEIKEVSRRGNILELSNLVCELAETGVIGIIDGIGGKGSETIQALCDMLEIPHVLVRHNDLYSSNWSAINLYPSPGVYNQVLESLIMEKEWNDFTILYVRGHSLLRVNELMSMGNESNIYIVSVRELSGDDYRDVLINSKHNGYANFVVDCPSENIEQLLLHAQQVGLMAEEHSYIFTSPDLFSVDMSRYRYGGVNMTGFRLINLAKKNEKLLEFSSQLEKSPEELKTEVLLLYDAIEMFVAGLKKVNITVRPLSCVNYDSWEYGTSLLNIMKTNKLEGITRILSFDGFGQRVDVSFDILELTPAGTQKVAEWNKDKLGMDRPTLNEPEIVEESVLRNKTLKVLIAMAEPHGFLKDSDESLQGNDRYEGFSVDLIHKLSERLGFSYEFEVEEKYGALEKGQFNGMVRQLIDDKADLAICDFTITAERQTGIDFSTPFMTLGIGILYKEPSKQPPGMFSFMEPFSKEVWYYMTLIQFALGVTMIIVGRISHKEWQNPVPCIEQPEELSNQFSFANSVWLIIGSVMQQGSEIAPIALGPRMITSVWWFFTMVMVASYVGTLVAFLTVESNVLPFKTVEELYNLKSVEYGCKEKGSTRDFFANSNNSMYMDMFKHMTKNKDIGLVDGNEKGVFLTETKNYAFFMESTAIEYFTQRHCDLMSIGGLLDSKSYGIGMKKGSKYKKPIDDALLQMKEEGVLDKLKDIWWKEKHGGGKCGEKSDEDATQLGMKNMTGAFVILGAGSFVGLIISIVDMMWWVFKRSIKYGTTFKYEIMEELKFAITFSGNLKPVKRQAKVEDDSAEALSEAEEKDEVRSLHSIKSTDTRKTHRSHSSRHSSRSLSVAFAKRRSYS